MAGSIEFRTPPIRSFTLNAVMIGILVGSLAMAYGLVAARRQPWLASDDMKVKFRLVRVGDLQLHVPQTFARSDRIDDLGDPFDVSVLLTDQAASTRSLVVGGINAYQPRSPLAVLNRMLNRLVPDELRPTLRKWQPAINFRTQTLVGASYGGIGRTGRGSHLNLLAVLTEDGRRYWAIYMSHLIDDPMLVSRAIATNRQLMANILNSATGLNLRDADRQDFFAVGLDVSDSIDSSQTPSHWLPAGLRARTQTDNRGEDPILLLPRSHLARVGLLRLRGVIDLSALPPEDELSPATLLANKIQQDLGRPPSGQELWSGRIAGTPVWRASIRAPNQSLIRQIWYAQAGAERGLLVEVLSEPEVLVSTAQWAARIIQAVLARQEKSGVAGSTGSATVRSAVAHGRKIAQRQIASLAARAGQDAVHFVIREDGRLIGAQTDDVTRSTDGDPLSLQGDAKVIHSAGRQKLLIGQRWSANTDGTTFSTTARWASGDPQGNNLPTIRQVFTTEQMQLVNHRLTYQRLTKNGEDDEQWSASQPEAFVPPMAEELWPAGPEESADQQESLIWMTGGRRPPQPYWIRLLPAVRRESNGEPPDQEAFHEMWLRPLMSLGTDRLTFDSQGRVLTYQSSRLDGWSRGARITATRVEGHRLLAAFPEFESQTEPWPPNGAEEP